MSSVYPLNKHARTSGHLVWCRIYAANVHRTHALGMAKHMWHALTEREPTFPALSLMLG